MATYAIGDLQGCFRSFIALLELINFRPGLDRLWMAGDLVNRGPDSLGVLRWMVRHESSVTAVLGNHDIHLLARAAHAAEPKKRDSLDGVLTAPDRDELLNWLALRPLLHREGDFMLLHGGLLPLWPLSFVTELARGIEGAVRGGRIGRLYDAGSRHRKAQAWSDLLTGDDKLGAAMNIMTNVRVVDGLGQPSFHFSGPPALAPPGFVPWYAARAQHQDEPHFIFGHWSALGFYRAPNATCLDSGCIWGQSLTALRLDDGRVFQQPSLEPAAG